MQARTATESDFSARNRRSRARKASCSSVNTKGVTVSTDVTLRVIDIDVEYGVLSPRGRDAAGVSGSGRGPVASAAMDPGQLGRKHEPRLVAPPSDGGSVGSAVLPGRVVRPRPAS